ncbi:DUF7352 domain-containing protein [Klebsiella pneumoniae]
MQTIWKYVFDETETTFNMPSGATILCVGAQEDDVCLWALVDTEAPVEPWRFVMVGTGQKLSEDFCSDRFVGTTQVNLSGTNFVVFHVFETEMANHDGHQAY